MALRNLIPNLLVIVHAFAQAVAAILLLLIRCRRSFKNPIVPVG
jgi:hypothetical protein